MISSLLNRGTIQIECLGLQFDGFDKSLNHSLQGILISAKEAKKALRNTTPGSLEQQQAKKRKVDDTDISSNEMIESVIAVEMEESGVKAQAKKRKVDDADTSSNEMIETTIDVEMEESGEEADSDSEASEQE